LTQENKINVSIYDALGKKIKTLVDSKQEPGIYTQKWRGTKENGTECKNGIYYLIIEHNNTILKRKLIKI
jgi:flagellar hook assembly protein FlgD